jgi:hypothetical protein
MYFSRHVLLVGRAGMAADTWHLLVRGSLRRHARQLLHAAHVGMLLVGLVMYGFMALSQRYFDQPNHYYVQGVGYTTIMDILRGDLTASGFLLLLVVAKLLVTCRSSMRGETPPRDFGTALPL